MSWFVLKPVWAKTGFTETGFVRPGETGFTKIETGFVKLAKPVSETGSGSRVRRAPKSSSTGTQGKR